MHSPPLRHKSSQIYDRNHHRRRTSSRDGAEDRSNSRRSKSLDSSGERRNSTKSLNSRTSSPRRRSKSADDEEPATKIERETLEGVRGAMQWKIVFDDSYGHWKRKLKIIRGVEAADSDDDGYDSEEDDHGKVQLYMNKHCISRTAFTTNRKYPLHRKQLQRQQQEQEQVYDSDEALAKRIAAATSKSKHHHQPRGGMMMARIGEEPSKPKKQTASDRIRSNIRKSTTTKQQPYKKIKPKNTTRNIDSEPSTSSKTKGQDSLTSASSIGFVIPLQHGRHAQQPQDDDDEARRVSNTSTWQDSCWAMDTELSSSSDNDNTAQESIDPLGGFLPHVMASSSSQLLTTSPLDRFQSSVTRQDIFAAESSDASEKGGLVSLPEDHELDHTPSDVSSAIGTPVSRTSSSGNSSGKRSRRFVMQSKSMLRRPSGAVGRSSSAGPSTSPLSSNTSQGKEITLHHKSTFSMSSGDPSSDSSAYTFGVSGANPLDTMMSSCSTGFMQFNEGDIQVVPPAEANKQPPESRPSPQPRTSPRRRGEPNINKKGMRNVLRVPRRGVQQRAKSGDFPGATLMDEESSLDT